MVTILNQSSISKPFSEFEGDGRLPGRAHYYRVINVMEELVKFTWLVRGRTDYLLDRYSERVESAVAARRRVSNL